MDRQQTESIDALTGLPTFAGLPRALDEPMPAIFLDIDGLRFVNHRLRHLAGDDENTSSLETRGPRHA